MFGAAAARARSEVFRELASLVKAGVSLGAALSDLGQDRAGRPLAHTLASVGREVSSGTPLGEALRRRHDLFPPLVVAIVEVGEHSGRLEAALETVAEYYERDFALRHLLTRELAYPFVLLVAIIFIPAVAEGITIWLTHSLAAGVLAGGLRLLFTFLVIGLPGAAIFWSVRTLARSEEGRAKLDAIRLQLPVVGGVARRLAMARFCRALAALHAAGVLMGTSLRLAAAAAGNAALQRQLQAVAAQVERGTRLSDALEQAQGVPRTVIRMIRTGEDSGELDRMAHTLADHYQMEAESAIRQMAVTITPLAVLLAAVIVGVMFITSFMDLYSAY